MGIIGGQVGKSLLRAKCGDKRTSYRPPRNEEMSDVVDRKIFASSGTSGQLDESTGTDLIPSRCWTTGKRNRAYLFGVCPTV